MNRIFSVLSQAGRKIVVMLCLMMFVSLSGAFVFAHPADAATGLDTKMVKEEYNLDNNQRDNQFKSREEAYEEALEDARNLQSEEKAYEENLENYRSENSQPNLLEKAEEYIEQVTGNS